MTYPQMCLCGGWTEETSSSADLCGLHLAIVISATAIHNGRTQKVKTTLKLLLVFPEAAPPAGSKTSTPLLFAQSTRAPVSRRKGHGPANIKPIRNISKIDAVQGYASQWTRVAAEEVLQEVLGEFGRRLFGRDNGPTVDGGCTV